MSPPASGGLGSHPDCFGPDDAQERRAAVSLLQPEPSLRGHGCRAGTTHTRSVSFLCGPDSGPSVAWVRRWCHGNPRSTLVGLRKPLRRLPGLSTGAGPPAGPEHTPVSLNAASPSAMTARRRGPHVGTGAKRWGGLRACACKSRVTPTCAIGRTGRRARHTSRAVNADGEASRWPVGMCSVYRRGLGRWGRATLECGPELANLCQCREEVVCHLGQTHFLAPNTATSWFTKTAASSAGIGSSG